MIIREDCFINKRVVESPEEMRERIEEICKNYDYNFKLLYSDNNKYIISLTPKNSFSLYYNSFRPELSVSINSDTNSSIMTVSGRLIRTCRFIVIAIWMLLILFQIFLLIMIGYKELATYYPSFMLFVIIIMSRTIYTLYAKKIIRKMLV